MSLMCSSTFYRVLIKVKWEQEGVKVKFNLCNYSEDIQYVIYRQTSPSPPGGWPQDRSLMLVDGTN